MNSSRLLITWTTLAYEDKALDAMNNYRLWLTWTTLGYELSYLDFKNNSKLWITWATQGCELRALYTMNTQSLVDMNDFKLASHAFRSYEQLMAMDDMCYSRSLAQGSRYYA